MKKLDGKVAIVTGGSRGIGKAIAKAFLDEGAKVAILARTKAEVEKTTLELSGSGPVVGYECDVSVERQVSEVSGRVFEDIGPASVLVNCAGVVGAIGPLEGTDSQAWWNTVEINLYGTYLWCKAVIHQMRQNRQGKIINISGGGAVPGREPARGAHGGAGGAAAAAAAGAVEAGVVGGGAGVAGRVRAGAERG